MNERARAELCSLALWIPRVFPTSTLELSPGCVADKIVAKFQLERFSILTRCSQNTLMWNVTMRKLEFINVEVGNNSG